MKKSCSQKPSGSGSGADRSDDIGERGAHVALRRKRAVAEIFATRQRRAVTGRSARAPGFQENISGPLAGPPPTQAERRRVWRGHAQVNRCVAGRPRQRSEEGPGGRVFPGDGARRPYRLLIT